MINQKPTKDKWEYREYSFPIADTGDYDSYSEIANGKISLITHDDYDDEKPFHKIVDAFNENGCEFYCTLEDEVAAQAAHIKTLTGEKERLTAQHDKEMEELLIWIEYNFRKMIGNENYKKYNYEDGSYSEKLYSRAELLQLFRNRK